MAARLAISDAVTAADLHDALAPVGGELMVEAMDALEHGKLQLERQARQARPTRQDRQGRGADRLERPARAVLRHIHGCRRSRRVVRDRPGRRGARFKILRCVIATAPAHQAKCSTDISQWPASKARSGFSSCSAPAAADAGGRISARHAAAAAAAAILMPRYKLIIEYDGAPFCGWQLQDNGASVQGALETAVKAICGEQVRVHGRPHRCRRACAGAGRPLRHRKAVRAGPVARRPQRASAAASDRRALGRDRAGQLRGAVLGETAALPLSHRQPPRNLALEIGRVWRLPRPLDTEAMHAAAQRLVGKHDFTTFRDTECQAKSPEKTSTSSTWCATATPSIS